MRVDMPTAMPSAPMTSTIGSFARKAVGSLLRPSYEGT